MLLEEHECVLHYDKTTIYYQLGRSFVQLPLLESKSYIDEETNDLYTDIRQYFRKALSLFFHNERKLEKNYDAKKTVHRQRIDLGKRTSNAYYLQCSLQQLPCS